MFLMALISQSVRGDFPRTASGYAAFPLGGIGSYSLQFFCLHSGQTDGFTPMSHSLTVQAATGSFIACLRVFPNSSGLGTE